MTATGTVGDFGMAGLVGLAGRGQVGDQNEIDSGN